MKSSIGLGDVNQVASAIDAEIQAMTVRNTPAIRAIRRKYSQILKPASPDFVLQLARTLKEEYPYRWIAYELIQNHPPAFKRLSETDLEDFGQGIDSWDTVDTFARTLSGPAWLRGQIPDELILKWAHSPDRWWRRAALVSTVALNMRSQGGAGDPARTLQICRMLASDPDDMVVKALSWALRELVVHDPQAVEGFLREYDSVLAARVKREVNNKLTSGLKNPKRKDS